MILQILLIIALIGQIVAAILAIRMTRRTKFNAAWILFFLAIVLISYQLVVESINLHHVKPGSYRAFSLWSTGVLGLCISLGLFYVKKILDYIDTINQQRALTEKRVLNMIISTEEKERKRFAGDLHDGLGPLLSSAKMSLSVLSKSKLDPSVVEIVANASFVVDEAIKEVKDISNNISPLLLQNFGVARALNNFTSRISLPEGISLHFRTNLKQERFSVDIETVLYRVGCEIVNNAIKHSGATNIEVELNYLENQIILSVVDNGRGIADIDNIPDLGGMGLKNIVSRLEALEGAVSFENLDRGVSIEVKISTPQRS